MAEYILVGKVVSVVGIRGEVKIYNYSDRDRFLTLDHIILKSKHEEKDYPIVKARNDGSTVIVKLFGVDDRNAAEKLRDSQAFITENDLRELPEDSYYIRDLIGCAVRDGDTGEIIGKVTDVLQNSAQDNYEIETPKGKMLLPGVKEFIREVDVENRQITVHLIPGFIDGAVEA